MGQLNNLYVSSSFQGLLKLTDSTQGLTNTLQTIQTGDGDNSPLQMSLTDVNISGSFYINNVPITNGTNGTSGTSGAAGSSGSSGTSGASGSSGSTGSGGTSGTSGDSLFALTGSVWNTTNNVGITGSLIVSGYTTLDNTIISGSLIGGVVNGGLIKIQTEANRSGSVQFNITSSLPVSSSNIVMGQIGPSSTQTGSVVISGSNNIIFNGYRTAANLSLYGYMNNQNIVTNIPTLNTGSLIRPTVSNNQLNSNLIMNFITSSVGGGNIVGNLIYGQVLLNSQSGSVGYSSNYNNSSVTINQNSQNLTDTQTSLSSNIFGGTITLNAISSSINVSNNITFGTSTFVTNSYFHTGSNNFAEFRQNIIGGFGNHIQFGGNPSSNVSRLFTTNILGGIGNVVNMDAAGSNTNMVASLIYGQSLSVNPKQQIDGMAVLGKYNKTITGSTIFVVGNGTGTGDRRNAVEITSNNETILSGSVKIAAPSNTGHSPSLVIGAFNQGNAAANITGSVSISGSLLLNGVTVSDGNRNGLITTGSVGQTQQYTGSLRLSSGSLLLDAGQDDVSIRDYFNRNALYKNEQLGKLLLGQTNMMDVDTQFGVASGSINLFQFGGSTNPFRTGSNNTFFTSAPGLKSGSNNTFIGTSPTFSTGSGNFIIGGFDNTRFSGTSVNNVFSIGTQGFNSFLFKEGGNPTTIVGNATISGSLIVNGSSVETNRNGLITTGSFGGSQSITGSLNVTNGITLTGNQFKITDQPITFSSSYTIGTANDVAINYTQGVGLGIRNGNIQIGREAGQNFLNNPDTAGNFLFGQYGGQNFESGSGNVFLHTGGSSFISGSNNVFVGKNYATITGGTSNVILGAYDAPETNLNEYMSLGNTNVSFITKRTSQPIRMSESLTITGSLIVTNKINNLKIWTGSLNTDSIGIGDNTLNSQTGSSLNNVAIGAGALSTNVTGSSVVAIGNGALQNSVAGFNLALGAAALSANTTGESNIGIGQSAFQANTIGGKNTAIGWNSGVNNLTGSTNTIIGAQALQNNVSGSGNVAIGYGAGYYSTGSNGFYVGNDNYGSLSNDQNKSLMYGEFNGTTANQKLQINARATFKNNVAVTGSLTVRNTRLSNGLQIGNFTNDISAVDPYIQVNSLDGLNEYKLQVTNSGSFISGSYSQDGSINITGSLTVSSKTSIANAMNLTPMDPLPAGVVGDLAVSGSSLFFYNGAGL